MRHLRFAVGEQPRWPSWPVRWQLVAALMIAALLPGAIVAQVPSKRDAKGPTMHCSAAETLRRPWIDEAGSLALPPSLDWPNGVAFDGQGRLLVGAITAPLVARFEAGRWRIMDIAAPGIFSVTSLTHDSARNLVWGTSPAFLEADADQQHGLYALDDERLQVVRFLRLPDDGFANDTEIAPDGRLLVTDSVNGRVLAYDWMRDEFATLVEDERLRPLSRVGAAGVTVDQQGRIYVTNFETGEVLVLDEDVLRAVELPRTLENPDGLVLVEDGALLVAEGAVLSGDGRLLRIADPAEPGQRAIEVLRGRLESPVNLTVGPDHTVYVTESRIRRKIGPNPTDVKPDRFRVVVVDPHAG